MPEFNGIQVDDRTRDYLERVGAANPAAIAQWHTSECPECGEMPPGEGWVTCSDGVAAHYVIAGSVVLGCEGYWVVNPAALGMNPGQWQDWRED